MKKQPIGIFDSGVGGLTIASAIRKQLPKEDILYYGDTAHLPYGDKSPAVILQYCLDIAQFLVNRDVKSIVIACNTASAIAYDTLVERYGNTIDIINVIDPVVDAVVAEGWKTIGVIGTQGTIRSKVYSKKIAEKRPSIVCLEKATHLLASMIEEGFLRNKVSETVIAEYLTDEEIASVDALVLGCTHYPLISDEIARFFNFKKAIIDAPGIVARFVEEQLHSAHKLSEEGAGEIAFYLSDDSETFRSLATRFFDISQQQNVFIHGEISNKES